MSDATVKRELAFLSGLYSFMISERDQTHLVNPVRQLSRAKKKSLKEVSRTRFLTREEYHRLLDACHQDVHKNVIKTAVITGMRHGELLEFERSWINWKLYEIHIPAEVTKGEKARVIPFSEELKEVLQTQCSRTLCAHIFGYMDPIQKDRSLPFTTFKNFFRAARTRAGLKDVRFHDLRHTFGSWWVQAGGDLSVLRDIMGHSTIKVTERYAHLDLRTVHRSFDEVSAHTTDTLIRKINPGLQKNQRGRR